METKTMTYMQALRLAMDEELARDDKVILLGQDVGILGGAYGVTGDLYTAPTGSSTLPWQRTPSLVSASAQP